jgi:hypothetical protein
MKKQNLVIIVVAGLILLSGSFYGGMQYGAKNAIKIQVSQGGRNNVGSFAGGGQRMVGQGGQQRAGGVQGGGMGNGGAGDFTAGEIIFKDDTSVTIKTRDGGSKIVFFSDKTLIDKSVSGATGDLSVGQQITVNGKTSTDGSVIAQNIQIRPFQVSQPTK